MDIVCLPDDPAIPAPDTFYYCEDEWDGGNFLTYPLRKGRIRVIPLHLRQTHPDLAASSEPYLEGIYPSPQDELESFIQTWLFFGLISEFFGLNDSTDNAESCLQEIKKLHRDCIVAHTTDQDPLRKRMSGRAILLGARDRIARTLQLEQGPKRDRIDYLGKCLFFSSLFLNTIERTSIDPTIRSSIAVIGEIFNLGIWQAAQSIQPPVKLEAHSWDPEYIEQGGLLHSQMIKQGWCPSMIEKIRLQNQSVLTRHYTSRLKLVTGKNSHNGCTTHACKAFQINLSTYQLRHATKDCQCYPPFELDEHIICGILKNTNSFPVLKLESIADDGEPKLSVETWQPGMPYVAISHVWADGLGNPRKTSLQRCQVLKISSLVQSMQELVRKQSTPENSSGDAVAPYYLWIDTLCCPIELTHKTIALSRITQVYRQAAHVLILDSSLMAIKSVDCHPAELLLRVISISPWMRRLWTLQEGALAKSLWVQFADEAASCQALIIKLFQIAMQDFRYMRIWSDVINELNQFQALGLSLDQSRPGQSFSQRLANVQTALHFRTVSEAPDEPLCVSTLLGLETKDILLEQGVEARTIALWRAIAKGNDDAVASRIIFLVEETLKTPGWRWVPKSLLVSSLSDPWLGFSTRVARFYQSPDSGESEISRKGIPTPIGLHVTLPGCLLIPTARLDGLVLHPWPESINPTEASVVIQDAQGKWMRIIDYYRSVMIAKWNREELREYDKKVNDPLCRSIDSGKCALIYDYTQNTVDSKMRLCCMVQVEEVTDEERRIVEKSTSNTTSKRPLKARRERTVILTEVGPAEARMMDIVAKLADEVAANPVTQRLRDINTQSGVEWEEALVEVRKCMKDVIKKPWEELPEFRQAVEDHIGQDLDSYMWTLIPKYHSHKTTMAETADDQVWIVD